MKKHLKSFLIAIVIPSIIIAGFNNIIFASNINPEIGNIGYWYDDSDVRGVISKRLGDT
jgi:hypothetical protein